MWKNFGTQFDGILKSLGRHKDLVESRGTLAQYRRYKEDMEDLKARFDDQVATEQGKQKIAVKEWLSVGDQLFKDHAEFSSIRNQYATTTRWIMANKSVEQWIDADEPDTPILWVHGIPGAGIYFNQSIGFLRLTRARENNTGFGHH